MPAVLDQPPTDTRVDRPEFYTRDFGPTFAYLREHDPVHWQAETQMWVVTRHEDLRTVASDTATYTTSHGVTVGAHTIARQLAAAEGTAADKWRLAELRGDVNRRSSAGPDIENMQSLDPPDHGLLRRLFTQSFTPAALRPLEDRVRELTRATLDEISFGDGGDFIDLLAAPVPIYVIAELLGVAKEDRDDFRRWSDIVISAVEPKSDEARRADAEELAQLFVYFHEQIEARRTHPQDDLLTLMLNAEISGESLSEPLIQTVAKMILAAGNETTRSSISATALALAQHPAQRQLLVDDPSLIGDAVNEFLRWATPVRAFCRTAVKDTELNGRHIERGDYLVLSFASGNRDGDVWPDATEFDVRRKVLPGHVAFGHGPHICLGQSLARLELKVVVEELLARFPNYEVGADVVVTPSTMVNTIRTMPVTFR